MLLVLLMVFNLGIGAFAQDYPPEATAQEGSVYIVPNDIEAIQDFFNSQSLETFKIVELPPSAAALSQERRHPDKTGDEALLYDYLADDLMHLTECPETFNFLYDGMPVSFPPSDVPYRPEQIAVLMLGVIPRDWAEVAHDRPIPPEAVGYVYGATVDAVDPPGFFSRAWDWLTGGIAPMSAIPESGHITNHGYVTAGTQGTSGGRYTITIDGIQIPAFCNNRNIPGPATGASHRLMGMAEPQALRALYFGWGGPGNIFGPGQMAEGVLSTTIVTSYVFGHTGNPSTHNLQGARDLWARVQDTANHPMRANVQGIFIDVLAAGSQNLVAIRVIPDPDPDPEPTPTPTPDPDPDPDPGQVQIIKTSESGVVAGVQFRITGAGVNQVVTTSSGGSVTVPGLQAGVFVVEELGLGSQYMPQPPQTVTVAPNQTTVVSFHNRLSTGGLRIVKTSESGVVAGIQFRITGSGVNQTVTTETDGSITVPGLQPGALTVEEVNLGSQYEAQAPQTVTVVANQTAAVNFHNTLRPGDLRIVKTSESGVIAGIQFRVIGNGVNQVVTTSADGSITVPNLRPGTYVTEEINLGSAYVPQASQTVTVRPNETTTVTFHNRLLRGSVSGLKVGEDFMTFHDADGLAGAVIGLFPAGTTVFTEATALAVTVSGAGGKFSFGDLLYGDYLICELSSGSAAYLLNEEVFPIRISSDGQIVPITLTNELLRGRIEGHKVGETTTGMLMGIFEDVDGLEGVTIGIFAPDTEIFSEETALKVVVTDQYGRFFFEMPYGYFLIRELSTGNDAYVLSEETIPVRIDTDGQIIEIRLENRLAVGCIHGTKTGETTEGLLAGMFSDREGLAGATIGLFGLVELGIAQPEYDADEESEYPAEDEPETELISASDAEDNDTNYDEEDDPDEEDSDEPEKVILSISGIPLEDFAFTSETAVQTVISAEGGSFSFEGAIMGHWVVREIYAPEGYVLNETLFLVEITADGEVVYVEEISNVLIRGSIEGIKVCSTTGYPLEGATFGLFASDETTFTADTALMTDTSGEDGIFGFEDIIFGRYLVRELAAPEGYLLSDETFEVEIGYDEQIVDIRAENERKPDVPDEPNEPNDPDEPEDEEDEPDKGTPNQPEQPNRPNQPPRAPQTGDDTQLPWLTLVLSLLGMLAMIGGAVWYKRRRTIKNNEAGV